MKARRRLYTAALYSGHPTEAFRLLITFPLPARLLQASAPALAWRQQSLTAQAAIDMLHCGRSCC